MNLLIVSHTPHYWRNNCLAGWGPTVREIDCLAALFDRVIHIAPVYAGASPPSAMPYQSPNVLVNPVPPAGGERLREKFGILTKSPTYLRAILRALPKVDMVHVRCPANISLLAMVLLAAVRHPQARWIKYAGNWQPVGPESWSYTFQRWWLHYNLSRSKVTINGVWPNQKTHEITFPNPSLTQTELEAGLKAAAQKTLTPPIRCVFTGRLEKAKGAHIFIEAIRRLHKAGVNIRADLIGDGPEAGQFEAMAEGLAKSGIIHFHGWLPRQEIPAYLKPAHFIILPTSASEGWPKVLSEGMAYGAVPVATALSAIPHYLTGKRNGWLLPRPTATEVVKGLNWFMAHPDAWVDCRRTAIITAGQFTYDSYLDKVRQLAGISNPNDKVLP